MTLREVTALVLLYRACEDGDTKRKVLRLIPELEELVGIEVVVPTGAREVALKITDYCASRPTADWSITKIAELIGKLE